MIDQNNESKTKYHLAKVGAKIIYAEFIIIALNKSSNLQQIMQTVSYTKEKIAKFSLVYEEAYQANYDQNMKQADKTSAYRTFRNSFAVAKDDLFYICKIAKVALRSNPQKIDLLQLKVKREHSIVAYFSFMENFYSQALNDEMIIQIMSVYGYHRERINDCYRNYQQALADYKTYLLKNTESVEATRQRDLKIAVLNEWMLEYYSLHKIAFAKKKTRESKS